MKKILAVSVALLALSAAALAQAPSRIEEGLAAMGAKPAAGAAKPGQGRPPSTLDAQLKALSRPAEGTAPSSIEDRFRAIVTGREDEARAQQARERQEAANALRDAQERNDYLARSGAVCKAQMNKFDACYAAGCKLPPVQSGGPSNSQCEALPPRPYGAYRGVVLRGGGCDADCWAASEARIDAQYARDHQAAAIEQAKWDAQYGAINKSCTARAALLKPYAACVKDIRASCNPANVTEASCMASRAAKPLTLAEQGITAKTVPAKAVVKNRALLTKVPDQPKSQQPVDKTMPGEIASSFGGTASSDAEARAQAEERMKASINSGMSRPFVRSGPVVCRAMPGGIAAFSRYCEVTAYFDSGEKPVPPAKLGTPCKEQGCGIAR